MTDQLELVPPSADSELDSVYGFEEADEDTTGADASMAVSALREELSRTEEELVNQQQQNTYLQERIQELESQLAAQAQDGVADADLANMEDRLREQRQAEPAPAPASEPWYSRISYWLIGLPVSYVMGFTAGWGGVGIWLGLSIGLAAACVGMQTRFWRRYGLSRPSS